jgi:hypothetical protein
MKSSDSRIEQYKLLIDLEQKRANLQDQIGSLTTKIDGLTHQLVSGKPASKSPAPAAAISTKPVAVKTRTSASKPGRAGRGELKSRIFSALENAGSSGVKVLDLARSLDTNPANIYAWFHAAVKRYPQIKKTGSAEYRLSDSSKSASKGATSAKPVAKPIAKPAKVQRKAKAPASAGRRPGRGGNKRGALQAKIIEALKSSGAGGITVKALADKFRIPYRNIQVWFATTGKKQRGIKKVAPATYRYAG